jgi:hypothetical protein
MIPYGGGRYSPITKKKSFGGSMNRILMLILPSMRLSATVHPSRVHADLGLQPTSIPISNDSRTIKALLVWEKSEG